MSYHHENGPLSPDAFIAQIVKFFAQHHELEVHDVAELPDVAPELKPGERGFVAYHPESSFPLLVSLTEADPEEPANFSVSILVALGGSDNPKTTQNLQEHLKQRALTIWAALGFAFNQRFFSRMNPQGLIAFDLEFGGEAQSYTAETIQETLGTALSRYPQVEQFAQKFADSTGILTIG